MVAPTFARGAARNAIGRGARVFTCRRALDCVGSLDFPECILCIGELSLSKRSILPPSIIGKVYGESI